MLIHILHNMYFNQLKIITIVQDRMCNVIDYSEDLEKIRHIFSQSKTR